MLPLGSRPDFSATDARGQPISSAQLPDAKRVAVVFLRAIEDARAFLDAVEGAAPEWNERNLVALLVSPLEPVPTSADVRFLHDEAGELARLFDATGNAFFLLGKDGEVKVARNEAPPMDELWAIIDVMPMRKREMQEQNGRA